jgi:hypothetical protein
MQNVDGFVELGDVHHTVDAGCVPDANLSCTGAHIVERLPVGRLKPGLDLSQLEACFLAGVFWERQQIVVGRPYPTDLFFIFHETDMYKILYTPAGQVKVSVTGARRTMITGRVRRSQQRTPKLEMAFLGAPDGGSPASIRNKVHGLMLSWVGYEPVSASHLGPPEPLNAT